jgi:hypothetical protein
MEVMHPKAPKNKLVDRLALFNISLSFKANIALSRAILALIILLPIVIFLLPIDFFDHGKPMCLSQIIFKMECYGCGLTRACKHLMHFDFERAFYYNMGSFVILPLVGILWIKWGLDKYKFLKNVTTKTNPIDESSQ